MLLGRLNGGRFDSRVTKAVSKELMELDMGDCHGVADVARHLIKQDYSETLPSCRSSPSSLTYCATSG